MSSLQEQLREALITLQRLKDQAERQRSETEALLEGLGAILEPKGPDAIFQDMFQVFERIIGFEHAFMLQPDPDQPGSLVCTASTEARFSGLRWWPRRLFKRVLRGKGTTTYSIAELPEWQLHPESVRLGVGSALYAPVPMNNGEMALFVMIHVKPGYFTRAHVSLVSRFALVASQALASVESHRLREAEVDPRTQKAALAQSLNRAIEAPLHRLESQLEHLARGASGERPVGLDAIQCSLSDLKAAISSTLGREVLKP
ncbi:MAG: GAF domain-containing protein [Bradymonadia bacterium]